MHWSYPRAAAASAAAVLSVAACGSSTAPHHYAVAPAASAPAVLTDSQATQICDSFSAWLKKAVNQDMPRLSASLQADESEAQGTQLGADLQTLDGDLQSINSAALTPQYPGQPSDVQLIITDCQGYGVQVKNPLP